MILRVASILASHRMGIVEPDESLTIRTVQRERIVNAMRFLGGHRHPRDHEFDPVASRRIDNEDLPIEIEKHDQRWIMRFTH